MQSSSLSATSAAYCAAAVPAGVPGGEADDKKISFKTYPAEDVIVNDGKANVVEVIKDPKLFCNATFFFAENLFGDIYNSIDEE